MVLLSVGFVDQELAVSVEEEHGILVVALEDPATAIFTVYLHLSILPAYLMLGQQTVVLVIDLQVGVAVDVVDNGVHQVAADGIADHVDIVGFAHIAVHYDHIGDMVVIPVGVAVHPEARPIEGTGMDMDPYDGAHMYHVVMIGVVEIGGRMHRSVRRRHGTTLAGTRIVMSRMVD